MTVEFAQVVIEGMERTGLTVDGLALKTGRKKADIRRIVDGTKNASPVLTTRLIEIFKPEDEEQFEYLAAGYVPISNEEYERGLAPNSDPITALIDSRGMPHVLKKA